jgi:membrane protease YdiL (CAAX protease family)
MKELSWLYLYLSLAFTLLSSLCGYRFLKKKFSEYAAFLFYFALLFILLLVIPCFIILVSFSQPLAFLRSVGCTLGNWQRGLPILAVVLPLFVLIAFLGAKDPAMQRQYPFAKATLTNRQSFLRYEIFYFFLYYLPWEFTFRGLLFFPLINPLGLPMALAIQTIISILYHLGHPDSEIFACLVGGFLLGGIAYVTGSIFYVFILHACLGIATDTFIYLRQRKSAAPGIPA